MRLLITGGAGFIRSNFIRYWLARNPEDDVLNVDVLTYAGDPTSLADVATSAGKRYELIRADIADEPRMVEVFGRLRRDVVVNFAAESHNSRAVTDPAAFVRTNVVGTHSLLTVALRSGVKRFHQVSTCEVFGDIDLASVERFAETSPYRPRTPYNASKAAADHLVRAYQHTFGLPTTISISCNNYGPYQYLEKVIPLFATNAIDHLPLPIYRQSHHKREWIHVLDHCEAVDRILREGRPGETYNVGTGEERTVEIADTVLAALEKPARLKTYVDDRPGHDRRYLLDHSKIERELAWRATTPFDQGVTQTIAWSRTHRDWWQPKKGTLLDETGWRRVSPERSA